VDHPLSPPPGLRGGIDLTGLAATGHAGDQAPAGPAPQAGAPGTGPLQVVEVTEFSFQSFAERSLELPVFLLLCSRLAPGCTALRERVEAIAGEFAGRLVLGAADVDAQPGIAQAFQVQAVPAMVAIVSGRPIPLFQGSPEDEQLRSLFSQVLQIAVEAGVGRAADGEPVPEPEPPPLPPLHQEAFDAIERGDYAAAISAYDQALKENPKDADARAGRAQVSLLQRAESADPGAAIAAAAATPGDVMAQLTAADAELLLGDVEAAFSRVLSVLGATSGDEREPVRVRLIELFEIVGATDPRVIAARKELASLLN
jgi:putative thioredoxin